MTEILATIGIIALGMVLVIVAAIWGLILWADKIERDEQRIFRESNERGWRR